MKKFWQTTSLSAMSQSQWESLCDGCGKCCLHKLIDDDTNDIYSTNLACGFLNLDTCRCRVYEQRQQKQPYCVVITNDTLADAHWLPDSCAYRLVAKGEDLPTWHPLQTGQANSTITQGQGVNQWAVSELHVPVDQWQDHIVNKIPLCNV